MVIETHRYTDLGLKDPVGIVGFPSVGLVSSIAANYYVAQLEMTPIAGLSGSEMPPYCYIVGGTAYPPIRMYGMKSKTKTGRDTIVCTSEYAPKPEDCYETATSVIRSMRDLGCKEVICLEGVPRTSEEDQTVIFSNSPNCERMVNSSGLTYLENGMIKGVAGIMMYEGSRTGVNVIAIMCPANPNVPDPGSAIAFLEPLSKMVKGLKVKPDLLEAEAKEINNRIESEMANIQKDAGTSTLYG